MVQQTGEVKSLIIVSTIIRTRVIPHRGPYYAVIPHSTYYLKFTYKYIK